MSRRLPLVAGAAIVSATLGAMTSTDVFVAALAALGSVAIPATALLPSLPRRVEREKPVKLPRVEPDKKCPSQESKRESPPEPPPLLKEREIEAVLRLAEGDTARFQERLRSLTSEQREQIRAALRARRTG